MSLISDTSDSPSIHIRLKAHKQQITGLAFLSNDTQLVSSSSDKSIMLWDLINKNKRTYNLTGHTDEVLCVDYSPIAKQFATGSQDQTVRMWVPSIKGRCDQIKAHNGAVRTVCYSPCGEMIATGSNDKSIKIWRVQRKQFLSSFTGHNNWVKCVKYVDNGKLIASCSDDKTLRVWDIISGQCIHTFPLLKGSGNYLSIHSNGKSVAIALSNGAVRIYDIVAQKLQQHYMVHNNATCVVWHPRANYLLSSGAEGTIKIIDVMEARPLYTIKGHEGSIKSVAFSRDGNQFASGGSDAMINIWNTNFTSPSVSTSSLCSTSQESL